MTKKQKTLFWGIVALLGIGGVLLAIFTHKPKTFEAKTPDGKPVTNGGANFADAIDPNVTLKKGDAGNNVKALQEYINGVIKDYKFNVSTLVPDGIFGNYTEAALKTITKNLFSSTSINGLKKYVSENLTPGTVQTPPFVWTPTPTTYTGS